MKSYADVRLKVTKNNIEIGDNVFIRQRKINKFSTPYSAVPLTVIDKNIPVRHLKRAWGEIWGILVTLPQDDQDM